MVTQEMVRRAQRRQVYCVGLVALCGAVWGVTWHRGGPTWVHEWSECIVMCGLFICLTLSFVEDAKEDQEWFVENQGPQFLVAYALAVAYDAAGESSEAFWKQCEELKPSTYTITEWLEILEEYRKKSNGIPSLV